MNIHIDRPALALLRFSRLARGRSYYLAEPPVLGILVIRWDVRIEDLADLVVDAALGHERGIDGWCAPGFAGRNHGKATIYRVVKGAKAETALSNVVATWRERYPMR